MKYIKLKKLPKRGDMIFIGPDIEILSRHEVIDINSKNQVIVWSKDKIKPLIFNLEFCWISI